MGNRLTRLLDSLPTLVEHTHLQVLLEGWPAAFSIASVCGSAVAVISILVGSRRSMHG